MHYNYFIFVGLDEGLLMPKKIKELSAIEVKRLSEPKRHPVGGVAGLLLRVSETGVKNWVLRTTVGHRRVDAGLGGYPDVSLSEARQKAKEFKEKVREGIDPIAERKQVKARLAQERMKQVTFEQAARDCHDIKKQEFKNDKHAEQWITSIIQYAVPVIGSRAVSEITTLECLNVLKPIWSEKTETASRLRQRMAAVFDYATAAGIRTQPNPSNWKGCLEPLLPSVAKVKKQKGIKHQPALPFAEIPRLYADLNNRSNISAAALRFLIMTACRSGEIRLARWGEFDFKAKIWTIPKIRMKAGKDHMIPLSDLAIELIQSMPRTENCPFVFSASGSTALSEATLTKLLKTIHEQSLKNEDSGYIDPKFEKIATPHGMRSSFKEWARTQSGFSDEVSELQLAHVSTDATRAAYARDSLLEQRRRLMGLWEKHCISRTTEGDLL